MAYAKVHRVHDNLAVALSTAARSLGAAGDPQQTLQVAVDVTTSLVRGAHDAEALLLTRHGGVRERAASATPVAEPDDAGRPVGTHPRTECLTSSPVVLLPDLRRERRWPEHASRLLAAGYAAELVVRLEHDVRGPVGVLACYSRDVGAFDAEALEVARLVATHVAVAVVHARQTADLELGLRTRERIGQAVGLLMAELGLGPDAAWSYLVRVSSETNTKVRVVAEEIVDRHYERLASDDPDARTRPLVAKETPRR